jgi:hypothetical protein
MLPPPSLEFQQSSASLIGHDRRHEREATLTLVGDQDAQIVGLAVALGRLGSERV